MKYWLHPEAESDLQDAAEFYREQADTTLSQCLPTEFDYALNVLLQHPRLRALWRPGKRRYVMRRFPCSVIYTIIGEEMHILVVAHHGRRPGYWRGRK